MALQLSNTTREGILNVLFKPTTLYAMIPAPNNAPSNTTLPSVEIVFDVDKYKNLYLKSAVSLAVEAGTTLNKVYFNRTLLTKGTVSNALMTINLTGDDEESYENGGAYIINTMDVALTMIT